MPRTERERDYAFGAGCVYSVVAGSTAYGLALPTSDRDIIGCFVPRPADFLGIKGKAMYRETEPDSVLTRLDEYAKHLVNGSIFWVESLFVPVDCVEVMSRAFREFYEARSVFLTQALVTKSLGFMDNMRRRAVAGRDEPDRCQKQLMHAVRVGRMINEMFDTGTLRLRRDCDRDELLAIKRGDVWISEAVGEIAALYSAADARLQTCDLPEEADIELVNELVWSVVRSHWEAESLL